MIKDVNSHTYSYVRVLPLLTVVNYCIAQNTLYCKEIINKFSQGTFIIKFAEIFVPQKVWVTQYQ